jgi:hypothetical protein
MSDNDNDKNKTINTYIDELAEVVAHFRGQSVQAFGVIEGDNLAWYCLVCSHTIFSWFVSEVAVMLQQNRIKMFTLLPQHDRHQGASA